MRDMQPRSISTNGYNRRSQNYSSPSLVEFNSQVSHYGSQPSIIQNCGNPSPPNYSMLFEQPVVVLRNKKPSTVRSAKEESRLRSNQPSTISQRPQVRSRPQSTNSFTSIASSGMENLQWRNSVMSSVTPDSRRHTIFDDEDSARVARLEYFQSEEADMLKRGHDQALKLTDWYKERLESLQKKARLLQSGSVSLDSSVHEQKLNFLRANITELNRRIATLMETSDKGFPIHNKQKSATNTESPTDDKLVWLHRQNQRLNQELAEKTKLIDQLRRENDSKLKQHNDRNIAFVRPAYQSTTPLHINNSPHKIYDTLM